MKPKISKKREIRKAKYRLSWFKKMATMLKNKKQEVTDKSISLS